ncbi:hypothetical protein [Cerasicoccus arenae]|uniref:Uncharacterized protein n=1 Tax=Cerasicoccus arenae TaxID=424488 RepID=A0A8J3DH73_9BACT|nr:hypothetical protein [Cerasicoccus arenae]MBK1857127.1 hypothetical protein [Cerasicoccus arenae]GHB92522.1 hypothetical protein GCM10007047_04590 [Cerasicoccus arenae]
MGLIFEVKPHKGGGLVATCHTESIYTQGVDMKELHSNINTAVDERFLGRERPIARDIHLLVSQD